MGKACDCLWTSLGYWNRYVDRLNVKIKWVSILFVGKVATTEQAEEVHNNIRQWLATEVSTRASNSIRIIYGGIYRIES